MKDDQDTRPGQEALPWNAALRFRALTGRSWSIQEQYGYNAIGNLTDKSDVGSYTYPASGANSVRPHAATTAGSNSYSYDANGNMLTRAESGITYTQTWDEENRLKTVTVNGQTTTFVYDGDGPARQEGARRPDDRLHRQLLRKEPEHGGGNQVLLCQRPASCAAAGEHGIARSLPMGDYFTADHLSSTSLVTDVSGNEVARQKYFPFRAPRSTSGTLPTDYRPSTALRMQFTGQRSKEANLASLYDCNVRFYSP